MMAAAEEHLPGRIADAIAVIPAPDLKTDSQAVAAVRIARVYPSSHPLPDRSSVAAANAAMAMLDLLTADDLLIVLLSGGASAMMAAPAAPVTLEDKIAVSAALLRVRASIGEINAVRKHLSAIKGGQLLRGCNGAGVLSLILSDVRGNDLATIGSGLTARGPHHFRRCTRRADSPFAVGPHPGAGQGLLGGGRRRGVQGNGQSRRPAAPARDQYRNRRQCPRLGRRRRGGLNLGLHRWSAGAICMARPRTWVAHWARI